MESKLSDRRRTAFPQLSKEKLSEIMATTKDPDRNEVLQEYFLQSLSFPQMTDRENEVNKATTDTYSWVLKDDSQFAAWLIDPNQEIYWINGKPGCGKSTLMRFVSESSITSNKLKIWSGERPFLMANYYFWTSGTKDQRSQTGLLRSLLYQLLIQQRHLIPAAIPDLWLKVWGMSTQERIRNPVVWEFADLFNALKLLLGQILQTKNVVLFVDGLDEFDGDHAGIISVFDNLVNDARNSLKLCLSSRSWPVFEEGYRGRPQFKMQDYTYQDIYLHIFHNLKKNDQIAVISEQVPQEYSALVEVLVQKAEGVFLWAGLAVKYICKVLAELDTDTAARKGTATGKEAELTSLQRLESIESIARDLPDELDDLFEWLVFAHPKANPAAIGLPATILKARETVTEFSGDQTTAIITLWDLATTATGPDLSERSQQPGPNEPPWIDDTESEIGQVDRSELKTCLSSYKTTLDAAAPGLLVHHLKGTHGERRGPRMIGEDDDDDLSPEQREARSKVTYAHRTVKDWLDQETIQQKLAKAVFEDTRQGSYQREYLPHLINLGICQISRRKSVLRLQKGRSVNDIWPFVVLTMTHARLAQTELDQVSDSSHRAIFQDRYIRRLTAINDLLTWYWRKSPGNPDDTWAKNSFGSYESRRGMVFNNPWLSICARFGLRMYILDALDQLGPWEAKGEVPVLSHAVEFAVSRKNTVYPLSDPLFVQALLDRGFSPSEGYKSGKQKLTPWTYLLENLQQAERRGWIVREDSDRWVEICNCFLKHGASLDTRTEGWAKDPSISARELLSSLRGKYDLEGLAVQ